LIHASVTQLSPRSEFDPDLSQPGFRLDREEIRQTRSIGYAAIPRAFPLLTESEAGLYDFDLTRFLHANRYPSSGQARGHASLENALSGRARPEDQRYTS
jgi:hypothetical protein